MDFQVSTHLKLKICLEVYVYVETLKAIKGWLNLSESTSATQIHEPEAHAFVF
jgi:hypothetical protein